MNNKMFDIISKKEKKSNTQTLVLGGDLNIRNAAAIKKRIPSKA